MSLTLSRNQFGKPILKSINVFKNPSLLNALADSQPAGRDVISFQSVTIGDITVDNTLPGKLTLTSSIDAGVAEANKALTLDNNRNVSGINKLYVDSIYINDILLDPSIFKGSAVSVSTDDSSRAELTNLTIGKAMPGKALVLNQNGMISGLNTITMEALENGNEILVNRMNNDIKMNNIEHFDRFYNNQCVPYFDNIFSSLSNIGFLGDYTSGADYITWNCYSNEFELHVATFSNGKLAYSNDGNVWTNSTTSSADFVNWFPVLSLFLAVGGNNLYTSNDGINWTTKKIANVNLYCIEWSQDLSLFVVGGQNAIYYTNNLNAEWVRSDYKTSNVKQIVYIETTKRFIGRDETNPISLIISNDGKKWSNQHIRSGGWGNVRDVFYSKSKNIIIISVHGSSGGRSFRNGLYSTDGGFTFKPIYSSNSSYGRFIKIVYVEDYSLFIGITDEGGHLANLAYSTDGINWRGAIIYQYSINAGNVSSVIYNKKTGHLFIRTKNNGFGMSQNFKSNLSSLNNTLKSYKFSGIVDKFNINASGNQLVNIGSDSGNLINFYNINNSVRNISLINGELNITSNSININSLISLNGGEVINFKNLTLLNKYTYDPWSNLNFFDLDERNKYNYLIQTNSSGDLNVNGILNVKTLSVGGELFDTEDNIEEFKGNKAGTAGANKFVISKYGNEVSGINKISCKKIKLDGVDITSKDTTDIIIGKKHGLDIGKKTVNCVMRASYGININYGGGAGLYPPEYNIQGSQVFMGLAGTTSDVVYYIKEFSTIILKSNNNIRFSPINSVNWRGSHILKTSMELFNANINFNKCEYIKELNTIYLSTNVGLYMSKDVYSWKLCNLTTDTNANVSDFTYSPRLKTMLIVSNTRVQMSKNGIDFKVLYNNINSQKLECVKWIESWGLFVGITSAGNNGYVKQFVYSYDGQIWDVLENNEDTLIKSTGIPNSIIYSPKLDIAIATEGTNIRHTYDGIIWKTIDCPHGNFSGNVIWVDELELFIASSNNVSIILFYSYDGIRWNQVSQGDITYNLNRRWQYIHNLGYLINTTASSTAQCVMLSKDFFKNNHINENFAVAEENSIISIDNKNNRVGLGVTTPEFSLHLGEDLAFKPTTSTWATSSDFRLKENIDTADLTQCLNNIKNIPLKKFKWKDEVYGNGKVNNLEQIGWIAQDVENIIPKAVDRKNMHGIADCRTLNNDQIIANMYGAVKRLIEIEDGLDNFIM